MTEPRPTWSPTQLEFDRQHAISHFRRSRFEESLELYNAFFADAAAVFDERMGLTDALKALDRESLDVLSDPRLLEAVRHARRDSTLIRASWGWLWLLGVGQDVVPRSRS